MTELECPATLCTYNKEKQCLTDKVSLKWRAAVDFPGKGTVLFFECVNYEGPQDRELQ